MDGHGNGDDKEETPKLPPITIAEDDQREYENRYRVWDMVIKTASDIEKISCDAQRKNTSSNEAELVCKLSNVIITLCKDHLLPIIPPLMPTPPDIFTGLNMAADLHHTSHASYYKIPELVNPKFIQEQNANEVEQFVVMNPKKTGTRPRTNAKLTKGDIIQLILNKNSPKPSVMLDSNVTLTMQKHRTFKHKQNTLDKLRNASSMFPILQLPPSTSCPLSLSLPLPPPPPPPPPQQPSTLPMLSSSSLSYSSSSISSSCSSSLTVNSGVLPLRPINNCEPLENTANSHRLQSGNDISFPSASASILSNTMDANTKASCFIVPNSTDLNHLQKQVQILSMNTSVNQPSLNPK